MEAGLKGNQTIDLMPVRYFTVKYRLGNWHFSRE
jgi:hypothetical protein